MSNLDRLFDCFGNASHENGEASNSYSTDFDHTSHGPKKKKKKLNAKWHNKEYDDTITYEMGIETIFKNDSCIHQVSYPPDKPFKPLVENSTPAKQYNFTLDMFQKQSIMCIDNNQSVLVSAHTSAGKTAVAEYAIALSLKNKQRVIYTTPIKALSNQKYRELTEEFKDTGLMTGDVTNEPSASCIVMTTEVLRDMLYRGSELLKEVKWVIFDEIHYMRDKSRGVVWEETIILLPDDVRCVFLSATIPNARQFAEWIVFLHKEPCHTVYTDHRPTPLQHYMFTNHLNLRLVMDKNEFLERNFELAMTETSKHDKYPLAVLIKKVMDLNWSPVLVFSFSKIECELKALKFSSQTFTTKAEQALIVEIFNNAISLLNPTEQNLPHVINILPMIKRGIAFHHSGLLPIIKEIIEILFGEGLIKILFATETFAMGLNMPAKTVIFTEIIKYDGIQDRHISSGEYIQMSGRAGRRGIDDKGIVIMLQDLKEGDDLKKILLGKADSLNSAFHLSYRMILNLLRLEEVNPEYLINKSFLFFQNRAKIIESRKLLEEKQRRLRSLQLDDNSDLSEYYNIQTAINEIHEIIRKRIITPENVLKFVKPGSIVKIKNENIEYNWGIVLNVQSSEGKKHIKKGKRQQTHSDDVKIEVLLAEENVNLPNYLPNPYSKNKVVPVEKFTMDYNLIYQISTETVNVNVYKNPAGNIKKAFMKVMNAMKSNYPDGPPLLHPILDMNIQDSFIEQQIDNITDLESKLIEHPCHRKANHSDEKYKFEQMKKLEEEIDSILDSLSTQGALDLELQRRKDVLRNLNYCNEVDLVSFKGRIACEFSTDELLLCEILFNGILNKIPVDLCVGLLSCLFCTTRPDPELQIDSATNDILHSIKKIISNINAVSYKANLLDENDTVHQFHPTMMKVIIAWCRGASFLEICSMTEAYEGAVIRIMRDIEEMLKRLYIAAKNIGNTDLEVKFSEGIKRLKRGIVFASSLYL